jgi:Glycosyl transferase family 2
MRRTKAAGTIGRAWADTVSTKFSDSLANLLLYEQSKLPSGQYIHFEKGTVSWHELMRNQLVQKMQGDWLFMLDTDHCFAPDMLERLQRVSKKYKAPVVSAIYQYKFPPHGPVMNIWEDTGDGIKVRPIVKWNPEQEVLRVGCCGAGALYIQRWVFEDMVKKLGEQPFALIPGLSEDYSFCYRCKKLDIPILVATKVEAHHMLPNILHVADYLNGAAQVADFAKVDAPGGVLVK